MTADMLSRREMLATSAALLSAGQEPVNWWDQRPFESWDEWEHRTSVQRMKNLQVLATAVGIEVVDDTPLCECSKCIERTKQIWIEMGTKKWHPEHFEPTLQRVAGEEAP